MYYNDSNTVITASAFCFFQLSTTTRWGILVKIEFLSIWFFLLLNDANEKFDLENIVNTKEIQQVDFAVCGCGRQLINRRQALEQIAKHTPMTQLRLIGLRLQSWASSRCLIGPTVSTPGCTVWRQQPWMKISWTPASAFPRVYDNT